MLKKLSLLATVAVLLVLQGCAGFPANNIAKVSPEQLRPASDKKVKIFSRWKFDTDSSNEALNAANSAIYKKRFEENLDASNCCIVVEGPTEADVIVDGTAHDENSKAAIIPALITGFSLYTIPSWVTITFHITANAEKGGVKHSYDVSDSLTMVQWLPMALAFPFANPFPMEKELGNNVFRTVIFKMKQDGILP
ncbi:MAG: hypothetical protein JWM03_1759 [Rhodocyclales bacterium]|nr:hypothetical protein [Rhodocyclales bacterium]MDB5888887.1 hypothetical protein [Rhodocyclales bacterium]